MSLTSWNSLTSCYIAGNLLWDHEQFENAGAMKTWFAGGKEGHIRLHRVMWLVKNGMAGNLLSLSWQREVNKPGLVLVTSPDHRIMREWHSGTLESLHVLSRSLEYSPVSDNNMPDWAHTNISFYTGSQCSFWHSHASGFSPGVQFSVLTSNKGSITPIYGYLSYYKMSVVLCIAWAFLHSDPSLWEKCKIQYC